MGTLVVGAGLAGLAGALALRDAGEEVTVVDPAGAGGKAGTAEPLPGWRVENGPHSFTHRAAPMFRLARRLGLEGRLVQLARRTPARWLVRGGVDGQPERLVRGGPFALTPGEWWRVARGLLRRGAPLDGSVADWLDATFGPGFVPATVLTGGIWAAPPDVVGFADGFPVLAEKLRRHGHLFGALRAAERPAEPAGLWGFPEGMGELVRAAEVAVGGVERVAVSALSPSASGWVASGVGRFDRVLLAVDPAAPGRLLGRTLPFRASPILLVHWLASDAALPHGFGYLAPPRAGRVVLGTLFSSDLHPSRAPAGRRSFATMVGGLANPEAVELDRQAALALVEEEHRRLTGRSVRVEAVHLVRHPAAVVLPEPGHAARVRALLAELPAGLAVAGSWCGSGAMPDAVQAGEAAAARLLGRSGEVARVA